MASSSGWAVTSSHVSRRGGDIVLVLGTMITTYRRPPEMIAKYVQYRQNILLLRTFVTCLRPTATAPGPSLESHFLIRVSSFSLSRPSAHFCLYDLSRIPTNFWWGSLLPLTTYFSGAIFLSLRCVLFSAFYNCSLAQLRM